MYRTTPFDKIRTCYHRKNAVLSDMCLKSLPYCWQLYAEMLSSVINSCNPLHSGQISVCSKELTTVFLHTYSLLLIYNIIFLAPPPKKKELQPIPLKEMIFTCS